jgi:tellurite resistance protein
MPFDPSALLTDFDQDKLDALVHTMVLAADADGDMGEEERAKLGDSIRSLAKGTQHEGNLGVEQLERLFAAARSHIASGSREALLASVKARLGDDDTRRAALGLAIAVTCADGVVRTSEREIIMELAEALDVDRDEAADMVRDIAKGSEPV